MTTFCMLPPRTQHRGLPQGCRKGSSPELMRFAGYWRFPPDILLTQERSNCLVVFQDFTNDVAVNVGEAVVAAGVAKGQPLVVEAHHVQDGRVQVVDVNLVFHGMPTEFVGGAVDVAGSGAAAGDPHGESEGVV